MWDIKKDAESKKWVVSTQYAVTPGFEFIILANTEVEARCIVSKLKNNELGIPTENSAGYLEIPGYDFLKPARVFIVPSLQTARVISIKQRTSLRYRFSSPQQAQIANSALMKKNLATVQAKVMEDVIEVTGNYKEINAVEAIFLSHDGSLD